jgi:Xaa-Pro aminopeptidase
VSAPVEGHLGIGAEEFRTRVSGVRERLDAVGLSVGLAYATQHMPGDVQYLTGYDPHVENAVALVLPDEVVVLGGPEGAEVFADAASLGEWRNFKAFEIPFQDYGDTRFYSLGDVLREQLGELPEEVGLISAPNIVPLELASELTDAGMRLRDVSEILADARYRKSPAELELFRAASAIATSAMAAMVDAVKPGVTELEVAAEGDRVAKRLGAYGFGFDTIVCSGHRIDTVIGRATGRRIAPGELVMLGVSPRYHGYTSALGRTVAAGGCSPEQRTFLEHGAHALELAAAALVSGGPAREIDLAARRYLGSVGVGVYHTDGVGHGLGLSECREWQTATAVSDYDLPTGIAMMLDVGLFGHPGLHGLRHENPYLIGNDGEVERLTDLPVRIYEQAGR